MLYIWREIARTDKHKFGALVYNKENNQTENKSLNIGGVINRLQNLERFEIEGGMGVNAGLAFPKKDSECDWVRFENIEKLLNEILQNGCDLKLKKPL